MAKNRTQLEEEAKDLGIDFSEFKTNAQFSEAIAAAKEDPNKDEPHGPEEHREVNTDTDNENPQDDQADIEAPMTPENGENGEAPKKGTKAKSFQLKTSKSVSFTINGVKSEGTVFEFADEDELQARKQMLIERYGAGVVKE